MHNPIRSGVLTIRLAGVIVLGEGLVAGTHVGTLGVVADVGAHSKLLTLVLICITKHAVKDSKRFKQL